MITETLSDVIAHSGHHPLLDRPDRWVQQWAKRIHVGLYGDCLPLDFDDYDNEEWTRYCKDGNLSMDMEAYAEPFRVDYKLNDLIDQSRRWEPMECVDWNPLDPHRFYKPKSKCKSNKAKGAT